MIDDTGSGSVVNKDALERTFADDLVGASQQ